VIAESGPAGSGPSRPFAELAARVERFSHLAKTDGGFPRVRPPDCSALIDDIEAAIDGSLALVRAGDLSLTDSLLEIVAACAQTDVRLYPRELLSLKIQEARIHLARGDFHAVRQTIGPWLDRPFSAEVGPKALSELFWTSGQLRLFEGGPGRDIATVALRQVVYLARLRPSSVFKQVLSFSPLLSLSQKVAPGQGWLVGLLFATARLIVRARRPWKRFQRYPHMAIVGLGAALGAAVLTLLSTGAQVRASILRALGRDAITGKDVFVSRAMGGIGDLIMMTPGLRALSKRYGQPIKFAISQRFFPIFENNPHVELIDIDSTDLDATSFRAWRNLTICPAAAYESMVAPYVKRGRVRLFAAGMGVRARELAKFGESVEIPLAKADRAFAREFLAEQGFGQRPMVGVQPYSRDSYKDHPGIIEMIRELSREFDVLVFHHTNAGVPDGPGIATTASLALPQSFALAAEMNAFLTVDSAFLHVAAAFDVPTVALFGPTDGRLMGAHHKNKIVLTAADSFICMPCWRNEDLPCKMTGQTGISPCMAAIRYEQVRAALDAALSTRRTGAPATA